MYIDKRSYTHAPLHAYSHNLLSKRLSWVVLYACHALIYILKYVKSEIIVRLLLTPNV